MQGDQEHGMIPVGISSKNILGRGISKFHGLLKNEQCKKGVSLRTEEGVRSKKEKKKRERHLGP